MFKTIGNFFRGLWNKFIKMFKAFMAAAFPVVSQIIIGQLQSFAVAAVTKLASTDMNNEEKRTKAFDEIKAEAIRRGLEARDSLLFSIVEIAYQVYKNTQ